MLKSRKIVVIIESHMKLLINFLKNLTVSTKIVLSKIWTMKLEFLKLFLAYNLAMQSQNFGFEMLRVGCQGNN